MLAARLGALAEARCYLGAMPRRVDLDSARHIERATHARLVADARRMRDDIERAIATNRFDRLLGSPAEQVDVVVPERDMVADEVLVHAAVAIEDQVQKVLQLRKLAAAQRREL